MTERTQRLRILVRHLLTALNLRTQGELARLLGYKTDSAFSQIINGIQDVPQIFVERIKNLGLGINTDWILTGEGEMILRPGQQNVTGNRITQQTRNGNNSVNNSNNTDDRLISIIQEQTRQLTTAQQHVTTAQQQMTEILSILKSKL